jgi:hypothetical protein
MHFGKLVDCLAVHWIEKEVRLIANEALESTLALFALPVEFNIRLREAMMRRLVLGYILRKYINQKRTGLMRGLTWNICAIGRLIN